MRDSILQDICNHGVLVFVCLFRATCWSRATCALWELVGLPGLGREGRHTASKALVLIHSTHHMAFSGDMTHNIAKLNLSSIGILFGKVDTQDSVQAVVWVKTTEFANMSGPKVKLMVCSRKKQDNNNSSLQPTQLNVGQWQLVRMSSHLLSRSRHCNSLYYSAMRYQQKKRFEIWQKHSLGFK